MTREYKRCYVRVKKELKEKLYELVLIGKKRIINVANCLGIKYQAAKSLIFKYRQKRQHKVVTKTKQCGFDEIKKDIIYKIRVISLSSDDSAFSSQYSFSIEQNQVIFRSLSIQQQK